MADSGASSSGAGDGEERKIIDMRSDTVTKPTEAMRDAMRDAVVGDDVLCDDPTVQKLEARGAEVFGKDGALFVPTGTMANLIAVTDACREFGSEFIVGDQAHVRARRRRLAAFDRLGVCAHRHDVVRADFLLRGWWRLRYWWSTPSHPKEPH